MFLLAVLLQAMARLETLKVSTLPVPANKREGLTALSSLVNLSRQQQVAALGALLFVMHKVSAQPVSACRF